MSSNNPFRSPPPTLPSRSRDRKPAAPAVPPRPAASFPRSPAAPPPPSRPIPQLPQSNVEMQDPFEREGDEASEESLYEDVGEYPATEEAARSPSVNMQPTPQPALPAGVDLTVLYNIASGLSALFPGLAQLQSGQMPGGLPGISNPVPVPSQLRQATMEEAEQRMPEDIVEDAEGEIASVIQPTLPAFTSLRRTASKPAHLQPLLPSTSTSSRSPSISRTRTPAGDSSSNPTLVRRITPIYRPPVIPLQRSPSGSSLPPSYSFVNETGIDANEISELSLPLQDVVNGGNTYVCTYRGTSQYASGSPSACGLASMNAARIVLSLERGGLKGCQLLNKLTEKGTMNDIMEIAAHWQDAKHLDVGDLLALPLFKSSLDVKGSNFSESARLNAFKDLFTSLLRTSNTISASVAAVITKPPEIVAIFVLKTLIPRESNIYAVFDSHPRTPKHAHGSAIIFFPTLNKAAEYLAELFHTDISLFEGDDIETQQLAQLSLFDAHIFAAKEAPTLQHSLYEANMLLLSQQSRLDEMRTENRSALDRIKATHTQSMRAQTEEHDRAMLSKEEEKNAIMTQMQDMRCRHSLELETRATNEQELRVMRESEATQAQATLSSTIDQLRGQIRSTQARLEQALEANTRLQQQVMEAEDMRTGHLRAEAERTPTRYPDFGRATPHDPRLTRQPGSQEGPSSPSQHVVPEQSSSTTQGWKWPVWSSTATTAPSTYQAAGPSSHSGSEAKEEDLSLAEVRRLQEEEERAEADRRFAQQYAERDDEDMSVGPRLPGRLTDGQAMEGYLYAMRVQREEEAQSKRLQEQAEELRAMEQKTFHCDICLDDWPEEDVAIIDICEHRVCRGCLLGHVSSKLEENRFPIMCPLAECALGKEAAGVVSRDLAECVGISQEEYNKWVEFELASQSVFITCRGCRQTAYVDREDYADADEIQCPIGCGLRWHKACGQEVVTGQTHSCDGTEELKAAMKENGWKACPGCDIPIERTAGCNHMRCIVAGCNTHFCYVDGETIVRSVQKREIDDALQRHYATHDMFAYPQS